MRRSNCGTQSFRRYCKGAQRNPCFGEASQDNQLRIEKGTNIRSLTGAQRRRKRASICPIVTRNSDIARGIRGRTLRSSDVSMTLRRAKFSSWTCNERPQFFCPQFFCQMAANWKRTDEKLRKVRPRSSHRHVLPSRSWAHGQAF